LLGITPLQAAVITFGEAITISADTDVSTAGTFVAGINFSGADRTVNGVTFNNISTAGGNADITTSGIVNINDNAFDNSPGAPFNTLDAQYRLLLRGATFNPVSPTAQNGVITLNNLVLQQEYQIQLFTHDNRGDTQSIANRTLNVSAGGNTVNLDLNVGNAAGGVGQFVIGTFTADSTSQVINLNAPTNGIVQFNAFQVRAIPEPSSAMLTGLGAIGLMLRRRRN